MKIKKILSNLFLSFFIGSFLFLGVGLKTVNAYVGKTCNLSFDDQTKVFAWDSEFEKLAITRGELTLSPVFRDMNIDITKYNGYINWGVGWQKVPLRYSAYNNSVVMMDWPINFSELKNYRISAYLEHRTGGSDDYFCANNEVWTYDKEDAVTEPNWMNVAQTVGYTGENYPFVRNFWSANGNKIAAITVATGEFDRQGLSQCSKYSGYECGYYGIINVAYPTRNIHSSSGVSRQFLWGGMNEGLGEQDNVSFGFVPDSRAGCEGGNCWVRGIVKDAWIYARPVGVNSDPAVPQPPAVASETRMVRVGELHLSDDSLELGATLEYGVSDVVRVPGDDQIKDVFLKMGYLPTNTHLVSNMISLKDQNACKGRSVCLLGDKFVVPDSKLMQNFENKDLSVWLVVKSEKGLVCTDKPGVAGVNAPACGAGVKTIRISDPTTDVPVPTVAPVKQPNPTSAPLPMPTAGPVVVPARRVSAAQIVAEYFAENEQEEVATVETVSAEERADVINIPQPNWNIFGW